MNEQRECADEAEKAQTVKTLEHVARWHDQQAEAAMGALHCGSENHEYRSARRIADYHRSSADAIRAMKPAP
jgi:hypothetical protein